MNKITKLINYFFIGFSYLASKKLIVVLEFLTFIMLLNGTLAYREELKAKDAIDDAYSDMIIEKKEQTVTTYHREQEEDESDSTTAVTDLIKCYQKKLDKDSLTDDIKDKINSLEELFNQNDNYFSFLYQDLYSGFTVSYNESAPIFTASTIKAPAMIYLFEQASQNKIDLKEELVYTSNFYHGGSGILQTKPQNTSYAVGTLIEYAIRESDNIAYDMLMNRYGRENILNFWQEKGTKNIYTLDTIWGITSAKDASIYMNELYRFYQEDKTYGTTLMGYFKNATWKLITDKNGEFNTASKGGWSGKAIHDVSIVFDKNPYLLIIMSNTGESDYPYLFQNTSKLAGELHELYWKYKEHECNQIKQY